MIVSISKINMIITICRIITSTLRMLGQNVTERDVSGIQFSMLDPLEIVKMSVAEISHHSISEDDYMKSGHLGDRMMGSCNSRVKCLCCYSRECEGHFGHIRMAEPFPNPLATRTIKSVLSVVCFSCGSFIEKGEECTDKECMKLESHEGNKFRKKIKMVSDEFDVFSYLADGEKIGFMFVYDILKMVSKKEKETRHLTSKGQCEYKDPHRLFIEFMPVPPPCTRPITLDSSSVPKHSHLTQTLSELIKCNNDLAGCLKNDNVLIGMQVIKSARYRLWYHLNLYFGIGNFTHPDGKDIMSINLRIKGKKGRIRGNIFGKRVDFSARTVITPDPSLHPGQIMVPYSIADNWTFPVAITMSNINFVKEVLIRTGSKYIKSVVRNDGSIFSISKKPLKEIINQANTIRFSKSDKTGEVECNFRAVECTIVLISKFSTVFGAFNRQPSLHSGSFMGVELVVAPEDSNLNAFGVPPTVAPPYNADFDGDEMNLHFPRNYHSSADVQFTMNIRNNARSGSKCSTMYALHHDSLLTAFISTKPDLVFWDRQQANMILMRSGKPVRLPVPAILRPIPLWTTHQLLSCIFPKDLSFRWPPKDEFSHRLFNRPCIRNGFMIFGQISKQDAGSTNHGMMDSLYLVAGEDAADYLGYIQSMMLQISDYLGFSIGLEDMVIRDESIADAINDEIDSTEVNVYKRLLEGDTMGLIPGLSRDQTISTRVLEEMSSVRQKVEKLTVASLGEYNALKIMSESGSKGSKVNITQIVGCLGYQHTRAYDSHRYGRLYQQKDRHGRLSGKFYKAGLPHFRPGEWRPEAKGFVGESLLGGLSPSSFFFHAQAGRDGGIDIPLATPVAGTLNRRMNHTVAGFKESYCNSVLGYSGRIAQVNSNSGMGDPAKLKRYQLDISAESAISVLSKETRVILDMYIDLSASHGSDEPSRDPVIKAVSEIIREVFRTPAPPSSDFMCVHFDYIVRAISRSMSQHVVLHAMEGFDVSSPRELLMERLLLLGLDVGAEIFLCWYIVTLASELLPMQVRSDVFGWHSSGRKISVMTMQPVDVNILRAVSSEKCANRHASIKAVVDISTEIICNINKLPLRGDYLDSENALKSPTSVDAPMCPVRAMLTLELLVNNRAEITDNVKSYILTRIDRTRTTPGDAVGIRASMAVCEPSTQLTLDTFSAAGQSIGLQGLPRVRELLGNGSSKEPTMIVRMNPPMPPYDVCTIEQRGEVKEILDNIRQVFLKDVVKSSAVYYLPGAWSVAEECDKQMVEEARDLEMGVEHIYDKQIYEGQISAEDLSDIMCDWMLRIEFNPEKLLFHNVSMQRITEAVTNCITRMHVISSPDNIEDKNPVMYIRVLKGFDDNYHMMQSFYRTVSDRILFKVMISGIKGIYSVQISEKPVIGVSSKYATETVLLLGGSSRDVLIAHDSIDRNRTVCTSVVDTLNIFGVEAARSMFISEISDVMHTAGTSVNPIHTDLIADIFTINGGFTGSTELGISALNPPIVSMVLSKPVDRIFRMAADNVKDSVRSDAASTLFASISSHEYSRFDMFLDYDALDKADNVKVSESFFAPAPPAEEAGVRDIGAEVLNSSSPAYGASSPVYGASSPLNVASPQSSPQYASSPTALQSNYGPLSSPSVLGNPYGPQSPSIYAASSPQFMPVHHQSSAYSDSPVVTISKLDLPSSDSEQQARREDIIMF